MTTGSTILTKCYPCFVDVAHPFAVERPDANLRALRRPSPCETAEARRA
jgi:hypothetical protein